MQFAAIIKYSQDKEKIQSLRPTHRQSLATRREHGQLAASRPFTGDSGALIVYQAASAQEAEKILQGDRFHQNGIFLKYVLQPWNLVIAHRELLPAWSSLFPSRPYPRRL